MQAIQYDNGFGNRYYLLLRSTEKFHYLIQVNRPGKVVSLLRLRADADLCFVYYEESLIPRCKATIEENARRWGITKAALSEYTRQSN